MSQQARRRRLVEAWTQRVRSVAEISWHTGSPLFGEVIVVITYFFEGASLDIDNVPKPILDALKGLVYSGDSLVSDLICRRGIWMVICVSRIPRPYCWKPSVIPNSFCSLPFPMH